MSGLFKKKEGLSKEQVFWNWFLENREDIEQFIDSDHNDYKVYDHLTTQVQEYSDLLFPELTKTKNNEFVLIITPDGVSEGVEPALSLAKAKPEISNWIIHVFRQPEDEITLNIDGLEYPSSDILIKPAINHQEKLADIEVFIRNMNTDPSTYQTLAFLYFDHIVGEYNMIRKVRKITFHPMEENRTISNGMSLTEFRRLLEKELS